MLLLSPFLSLFITTTIAYESFKCFQDPPAGVTREVLWRGQSVPLIIEASEWETSEVSAHIFEILAREALAYKNVSVFFGVSDVGFARMAGCPEPWDWNECLGFGPNAYREDYLPDSMIGLEQYPEEAPEVVILSGQKGMLLDAGFFGTTLHEGVYINKNWVDKVWNEKQLPADHWRTFTNPDLIKDFPKPSEVPNGTGFCDEDFGCTWGDGFFHAPNCDPKTGHDPNLCATWVLYRPDWIEGVAQQWVRNLGLNVSITWTSRYGEPDAMLDWVMPRAAAGNATAFFWWEPSALMNQPGLSFVPMLLPLAEGTRDLVDYDWQGSTTTAVPPLFTRKYAWAGLRKAAPTAWTFLQNFKISNPDLIAWENGYKGNSYGGNMTNFEQACLWVRNNEAIWKTWIPAECGISKRCCKAGSFGDLSSPEADPLVDCHKCPPGSFTAVDGETQCTPCPAGMYNNEWGQTECTPCEPGHYFPSTNSTQCLACPIGTAVAQSGSPHCNPCPLGQAVDAEGSVACIGCVVGSYMDREGAAVCLQCPNATTTAAKHSESVLNCSCLPGYFHPTPATGQVCLKCPLGGRCEGHLSLPYADVGFWGESAYLRDTVNTSLAPFCTAAPPWERCSAHHAISFYECASQSMCSGQCGHDQLGPEAPLVATCRRSTDNICSENRAGRMCDRCEDNYFSLGGSCLSCPDSEVAKVSATLVLIIAVLVLWVVINFIASDNYPSVDICLFYLQIADLIGRFGLRWSPATSFVFGILSMLNFDVDFVQPSCIMNWTHAAKFSIQMLLPAVFAGFYLLVFSFATLLMRLKVITREHQQEYADTCIRELLSFLNVTYMNLCMSILGIFMCVDLPDGSQMLVAGPQVVCNSEEHHIFIGFAVLGLLVYVVGVPVGFAFILYYGRKNLCLSDAQFLRRFSFLYHRYRSEYYWWELTLLIRRFAFSAILVALAEHPLIQACLAAIFLVTVTAMHFRSAPFIDWYINLLESASLYSNFLLCVAGVLYYTDSFPPLPLTAITIALIVAVVLVAMAIYRKHTLQARIANKVNVTLAELQKIMGIKIATRAPRGSMFKAAALALKFTKVAEASAARTRAATGAVVPEEKDQDGGTELSMALSSFTKSQERKTEEERTAAAEGSAEKAPAVPSLAALSDQITRAQSGNGSLSARRGVTGELTHLFDAPTLHKWLKHNGKEGVEGGAASIRAFSLADKWLSPSIAETSATSVYSHTDTAHFYHTLFRAFPNLLYCLGCGGKEDVEALRRAMQLLQESYMDPGSLAFSATLRMQHVPSLGYWAVTASEEQRDVVFRLIESVAQGMQMSLGVRMSMLKRGIPNATKTGDAENAGNLGQLVRSSSFRARSQEQRALSRRNSIAEDAVPVKSSDGIGADADAAGACPLSPVAESTPSTPLAGPRTEFGFRSPSQLKPIESSSLPAPPDLDTSLFASTVRKDLGGAPPGLPGQPLPPTDSGGNTEAKAEGPGL
eukprot:CAMPEP_0114552622 /NCGR_PEP_ID=MMETSP0114-20121206/7220_1 /TAXON_ID=31324 /ORGANISM="Goniomonas sp, Strain m" /LENGTH=1475 /DNA_ID=CAMNT_0001737505 /DNA_START=20 /DNA_END=4447 /DNA_ORIENTATION=+